MVTSITPREFHAADGVDDWRVLGFGAYACFRTGSFAAGVGFVDAIAALAEAANHHPAIDLRYSSVTVRTFTDEVDGLSERDVALAREISAAARDRQLQSDPAAVQATDFTVDATSPPDTAAVWAAALNYAGFDTFAGDWLDRGPGFRFEQIDAPRPGRDRMHTDVFVPHDQAESRVAAAIAAGARLVSDHAPAWWTLADPDGNEIDICTWQGRD